MKNKILVIDDEFLIRYTLAEGLKDRGYETESAGSVEEGLEKMKTFGPEVILLDNLLENSRGMDEIPAFRKLDENVQVIMMTAYGSVSQAVEAIKRESRRYAKRQITWFKREEQVEFLPIDAFPSRQALLEEAVSLLGKWGVWKGGNACEQ